MQWRLSTIILFLLLIGPVNLMAKEVTLKADAQGLVRVVIVNANYEEFTYYFASDDSGKPLLKMIFSVDPGEMPGNTKSSVWVCE